MSDPPHMPKYFRLVPRREPYGFPHAAVVGSRGSWLSGGMDTNESPKPLSMGVGLACTPVNRITATGARNTMGEKHIKSYSYCYCNTALYPVGQAIGHAVTHYCC